MDRYDARIQELKDDQFEISGLTAPLALDDPERLWYQRRASENSRELRTLVDHAPRLRDLDDRRDRAYRAITEAEAREDARVAGWRRLARWTGGAAGLLLLLAVWSGLPPWMLVVTSALVSACVFAWRRSRPDPQVDLLIVDQGEIAQNLENQREMILKSTGQSPSASSPDQAPERSSGYSAAVSELSDQSWS